MQKESLIEAFKKMYPNPSTELQFSNSYELLICVILSAQCTDKKVNEVTPGLFLKFPSFTSLSKARVSTVEKMIRPINYYKTKSKNIIATSKAIVSRFHSEIPKTMEELISLPGVGRKTANVVLGELGIVPTLPVDTHVFRVSKRLGIATGKTPQRVEEELKSYLEPKMWRSFHHWLILHGRRVCKAVNPRCNKCQIEKFCPKM